MTGPGRYLVYTDAPPLGKEGTGMAVLAHRFIRALKPDLTGYVTRMLTKRTRQDLIGEGIASPLFLSWDCSSLHLRMIHGARRRQMDYLLLKLWLWTHDYGAWKKTYEEASEIVGLSGANWKFLERLHLLSRTIGLPYSVYVVDDFEETLRLTGTAREQAVCHEKTGEILRQASRVFAISPGLAERLARLYGINSRVLYPVTDYFHIKTSSLRHLERRLVYVGSLNHLYIKPLQEIASVLADMNKSGGQAWTLHLITRDKATYRSEFADIETVTVDHSCDREQLQAEVARSELTIMPYSFDPAHRLMVETSFPSKFMDAIIASRPILVYAPEYASITRHMRMERLDYVATSKAGLTGLLNDLPWNADDAWLGNYNETALRHHSDKALREAFHEADVTADRRPGAS
jgi:hypothetical protein